MKFQDHFSHHADDYARYRPNYPAALFEFLAQTAAQHEMAWDCGTGNGQAALALAAHFDRVIATDASAQQIRNATAHEKIDYLVTPAEQTDLASRSVDLITVAQALHWFRLEAFYQEARRVLKPAGAIAAWCYGLSRINPEVDKVVQHYYANIVGPYWPSERHYIDEKYQSLPFPFAEIPTPEFYIKIEWDLNEFISYLLTWSASQRFEQKNQQNPIHIVHRLLAKAWGPEQERRVIRWPIYLRLGKVSI
ncbi:MAG: class I SAM-dependent methyltransferase [Gammaproteobacteria bacterium]|nr:class I SAM-dependent methyltransferase [Gammaproteobacteria bacterium]